MERSTLTHIKVHKLTCNFMFKAEMKTRKSYKMQFADQKKSQRSTTFMWMQQTFILIDRTRLAEAPPFLFGSRQEDLVQFWDKTHPQSQLQWQKQQLLPRQYDTSGHSLGLSTSVLAARHMLYRPTAKMSSDWPTARCGCHGYLGLCWAHCR